jgi:dihydrolipoamide dehydrogenase
VLGEGAGFVKIVGDEKTSQILGVQIVGYNATELIGEAAVAIRLEATVEELAETIHPHPTLSEAYMEAAEAFLGQPIHAMR